MRRRLSLLAALLVFVSVTPHLTAPPQADAVACDPLTQLCITVDTSSINGPAKLRAQGFLYGVYAGSPNLDMDMVAALKPQHWRGVWDNKWWDGSKGQFGGNMSWIIRGEWWHHQAGSGKPPSGDGFVEYEQFVKALAQKHIDEGRPIDFWDIFNEPDFGRQPGPECSGYDPCTNLTYLEEVRHAAKALRSVDPDAKIVIPSTTIFRESAGGASVPYLGWTGTQLDLMTIAEYVTHVNQLAALSAGAEPPLKVDAIAWHELNTIYYNAGRLISPRTVIDHVAKARAVIAAHPALGSPEIHINEYSTPWTEGLPGWEAGWIGSLEDADVDRAMRSCWGAPDSSGIVHGGCSATPDGGSTLDQLFNINGTPRAVYWVHRFYADMTGNRVGASVAAPAIPVAGDDEAELLPAFPQDPTDGAYWTSAFATRDDATSTVRALIGRHYSCSHDGVDGCNPAGGTSTASATNDEGNRPVPPSLDGKVSVAWPYASGAATVVVKRVPRVVQGEVLAPDTVSVSTVPVTNGETLTIDLGQVADGEAYTVTVQGAEGGPLFGQTTSTRRLL